MKTAVNSLLLILSITLNTCPVTGATIAWWRFQEGPPNTAATGTGTIIDSANGFNGTPVGAPVYVNVSLPQGSASPSLGLRFDGAASRIFIPDNPAFYLTNSLTIEAFIRYDGQPNGVYWSQILMRGDDRFGVDPYWLGLDPSGVLTFEVDTAVLYVSSRLTSQTPIPRNVFLHVAGTLDGATGQQRLFINGLEVASTNTTVRPFGPLEPTQTPGFGIGNVQSPNYIEYFDGVITEVRLSDVALPPSEFLFAHCKITDVFPATNGVQLGWTSLTNSHYQVQWTPALDSHSWSNVGPVVAGNGATNFFLDTSATNTSKFYRIQVLP